MKHTVNRTLLGALLLSGFITSNTVLTPATRAEEPAAADTKSSQEAPALVPGAQKPVQPSAGTAAGVSVAPNGANTSGSTAAKGPSKPLTPIEAAKALYRKNEYQKALTILDKLPPSESRMYFSGLCHQGLGIQKKATEEFAWVAYYAKDANLRNYALTAIRNGKPGRPSPKESGRSTSTIERSQQSVREAEENTRMLWGKMRAANGHQGAPWNTGVRSWSAQEYDHNQIIRGFDDR